MPEGKHWQRDWIEEPTLSGLGLSLNSWGNNHPGAKEVVIVVHEVDDVYKAIISYWE